MAMRLPATSSSTYTSSASVPLANTSKTSSASSSVVPGGRVAIICSTSSRLIRTRSSPEHALGPVGVGDHHDDLRLAAARRGGVHGLDVDLGSSELRGDGLQRPGTIVHREQQGGLLFTAKLDGGERLL